MILVAACLVVWFVVGVCYFCVCGCVLPWVLGRFDLIVFGLAILVACYCFAIVCFCFLVGGFVL